MNLKLKVIWAAILAAGLSGTSFAGGYGVPIKIKGRSAARAYFSPTMVPLRGVFFRIGPTDRVGTAFDTILFQGEMPSAGVTFEASRGGPAGWSPWKPATVKRFANGRFWAKIKFDSAADGQIQIRAINAGARSRGRIEIYTIEAVPLSAASAEESGGEAAPAPPEGEPAVEKPAIISRNQWGAKPPRSGWSAHKPYRFTQHHTQGRRPMSLEDSKNEVRIIQDFHQNGRGWKDIGYHFLIDASGRIFQGRPEGVGGAHARGENDGNVGISLMGNHHPPKNHSLTKEQKESIKRLGRWLMSRYGIKAVTYKGHRDYNPTDCPGDVVYGQLGTIRRSFTTDTVNPGGVLKVHRYAPKDPRGELIPVDGS